MKPFATTAAGVGLIVFRGSTVGRFVIVIVIISVVIVTPAIISLQLTSSANSIAVRFLCRHMGSAQHSRHVKHSDGDELPFPVGTDPRLHTEHTVFRVSVQFRIVCSPVNNSYSNNIYCDRKTR